MATIPKLALIPSGYKAGKLYSVLPTDGSGDLDFARTTTATRVNQNGLIEEVLTGVPRLNYPLIDGVVNGCPSLLLENSATNLLNYSEDFSQPYWTKTRGDITSNVTISPNGSQDASLFTSTVNSTSYIQTNVSLTVSGSKQTISCFVKKETSNWCYLLLWDSSSSGSYQYFNIEEGTVGVSSVFGTGISVDDAKVEEYPNNWFRISATYDVGTIVSLRARVSQVSYDDTPTTTIGSSIYIWGFQTEQGSYATSYIPNFGTALTVTRSADTANGSGNASTFNDSEGVLFFEGSAFQEGTDRRISLSDNSLNNYVSIGYSRFTGLIVAEIISNGVIQTTKWGATGVTQANNNKFALSWGSGTMKFYVNGTQTNTESVTSPIGLIDLSFKNGIGNQPMFSKTKDVRVYNTALTSLEIETLTSYSSFNAMALAQNYIIQ